MNAVKIKETMLIPVEKPFEVNEFPPALIQAFGELETTLWRLVGGAA